MSAKDKMVKAVAARKGVAPTKEQKKPLPKDALSYTEMRHYEPEFSAADAKWLVLGRMHVQKAAPRVALASILVAVLLALAGYFLLRPLPFMLCWLMLCFILLAVSLIALVGTIRAVPALLLPYLFAVWALTVISFASFFFMAPMAMVVPTFWNHWVTAAFGITERKDGGEKGFVRIITIITTLLAFGFLCLFNFLNYTMLRARNFMTAKSAAKRKGLVDGNVLQPRAKSTNNKNRGDKRVQVLETVA